ncbi:DUF3231 family protein [Aciduricibacillus chroicocephali]|uniref:DUF3231 family protein n=1 Tax=Aciduricibacillus chroicocephali TaxID=3054939 RepID=A0ABY9KZ20_9BACI|nr:DUF3231 family protein [Bacillaceae bacterium 44XB]
MGILDGNPKDEPLHYGEVFSMWSYMAGGQGIHVLYQTLANHAGDEDLKKLLHDIVNKSASQIKQVALVLKENGVALPPSPPEPPTANLEDIPAGARIMDQEICAIIGADTAAGLMSCSQIMGMCIREDIAKMFGQFHMEKAMIGEQTLHLSKEKGWLIPPPLHNARPENA